MNGPTQETIIRLGPWEYAHILDENNNITQLLTGPQTRTLATSEVLTKPVTKFHAVPRGSYCIIENPHAEEVDPTTNRAVPALDKDGQVKILLGETEVRYNTEPFPLYPEEHIQLVECLPQLGSSEYLVLRALLPHTGTDGTARREGEKFLWKGPGTYYPRKECEILARMQTIVLEENEALHCLANEALVDQDGNHRSTGEEYLYTTPGELYLLPEESSVRIVKPMCLRGVGLHIWVKKRYMDHRPFAKGTERKPGDFFLVTGDDNYYFIPHPYDRIIRRVERVVVSPHQFCVIRETNSRCLAYPLPPENETEGKKKPATTVSEAELGSRIVKVNTAFYLQPWQTLVVPPREMYLLNESEAILLRAIEEHMGEDENGQTICRERGDQWLVRGPCSYVPNSSVMVVPDPQTKKEKRKREVLSEGEGLYVRNTMSGEVRAVMGPCSYMLDAYEELWEKKLSPDVELNLQRQFNSHAAYMDRTAVQQLTGKTSRAVVYHIPHQSVTQLFNYKSQTHRVVFGPNRVALEPEEEFTVISLSGSPWDPEKPQKCMPKETNRIKSLYLFLGPANMTDVVYVETRDHAQLALQLCYDWFFDIPEGDHEAAARCFSVNDFVGDCCSFIASRIRSAVASLPFEEFHKHSAKCLKQAVFGLSPAGECVKELRFKENNLVITSVDTQELEVLDQRTRLGLQKSVKMAIEITTNAQEASAMQIASAREQEARGKLERQSMMDQVENEKQRKILLEAESKGLAIINSGKSKAIAGALSTANELEGNAAVAAAEIQAQSDAVLREANLEAQKKKKGLELKKAKRLQEIRNEYENKINAVRYDLMREIISALGPSTIAEIAKSGPELQTRLLSSLGLEGYLVTDGSSPINLYQTATGLTGTSL
eukprot:gene5075-3661_t